LCNTELAGGDGPVLAAESLLITAVARVRPPTARSDNGATTIAGFVELALAPVDDLRCGLWFRSCEAELGELTPPFAGTGAGAGVGVT